MELEAFVYDGGRRSETVARVRDRLADRPVRTIDVSRGPDAMREGTLVVKEAVRVGQPPAELYDADGTLDFGAGALVTVAPTGRKELHVGEAALTVVSERVTD